MRAMTFVLAGFALAFAGRALAQEKGKTTAVLLPVGDDPTITTARRVPGLSRRARSSVSLQPRRLHVPVTAGSGGRVAKIEGSTDTNTTGAFAKSSFLF